LIIASFLADRLAILNVEGLFQEKHPDSKANVELFEGVGKDRNNKDKLFLLIKMGVDCYNQAIVVNRYIQTTCFMSEVALRQSF
jgi:hypothetical protein